MRNHALRSEAGSVFFGRPCIDWVRDPSKVLAAAVSLSVEEQPLLKAVAEGVDS